MSDKVKKPVVPPRPIISAKFAEDFKKQFDILPNRERMKIKAQLRGVKKRRRR